MPPITITLNPPANRSFTLFDSFQDLSDEELSEIVVQCRSATAAFFAELSDRQKPWDDYMLEHHCETIQQHANRINGAGLTTEYTDQLRDVHTFLADPSDAQAEHKGQTVARHFLWLVSRVMGWSYALLILCALGRNRVQRLDEDQRVKIVKFISKWRGSLYCWELGEKAIEYRLDQICMVIHCIITSTKPSQVSQSSRH